MPNPPSLEDLPDQVQAIAADVRDADEMVRAELGPGLPPRIHQLCVTIELRELGRAVETDVHCPLTYRGVRVGVPYQVDLLVDEEVVVDVRRREDTLHRARAAVRTGLVVAGHRVGVLLDIGAVRPEDGFHLVQRCQSQA